MGHLNFVFIVWLVLNNFYPKIVVLTFFVMVSWNIYIYIYEIVLFSSISR